MADATPLDDVLLSEFMDKFYGYGNPNGRYWFIGVQEGGGRSVEEIQARLKVWARFGKPELEDVAKFHHALAEYVDMPLYYGEPTVAQKTWHRLIRVVLSAKNGQSEIADSKEVNHYQGTKLGRTNDETCMLTLLPLPCPSTSDEDWPYGQWSNIPELEDRKRYIETFVYGRAQHIKSLVENYQPAIVIFYGFGLIDWWKKIATVNFETGLIGSHKYYYGDNGKTKFVIAKLPHAISHAYYHQLGKLLST